MKMNEQKEIQNSSLGGYVTSTKSFIGKQRKIDQNGLFSEQIFGPIHNYTCSCGNYNIRSLYAGKMCPKCGVICTSNELRHETFGKIKMLFPIIKPSKKHELLKIIKNKHKMLIDPIRADINISTIRYLAVNSDYTKVIIVQSLDPIKDHIIIPFRITGIYSLILCLRFINDYFNVPEVQTLFDNNYITNEIKVLPPNLRLITYDDAKKEERVPKVNKFYTSILGLNKVNSYLQANLHIDEQDWLDKIRVSIENNILDQDIVEPAIMEYDITSSKYQWWSDEIYKFVYSELSGKMGLIRSSILGRNIEFSARTVVTADPSLPPYQIKVSKKILKRLWLPYFIYYLKEIKGYDEDYTYETFLSNECNDTLQFNIMFDEFLNWFMNEEDE